MCCGYDIVGGVGQFVVVGIKPYYHGMGWVDINSKGYKKSISGGVGLVSTLRLGYCCWYWTIRSFWHKAIL